MKIVAHCIEVLNTQTCGGLGLRVGCVCMCVWLSFASRSKQGIHGTYFSKWSPKRKCQVQIWKQIKEEGLKPMGRNHIHFVPHEAIVGFRG